MGRNNLLSEIMQKKGDFLKLVASFRLKESFLGWDELLECVEGI